MGNNVPPPPKPPTMEETIIEMKMTARRFANESKKAEREEKENMKKAKLALKKNNEEGAKLYLMSAAAKHNECTGLADNSAMNMQRMSMKMDNLVTSIKSSHSNQVMMGAFNKITNLMYYSKQPNIEVMATDLERFENCMDEMLINGKVMDEMMNKNTNTDSTADQMMEKLRMEMALEVFVVSNRRLKLSLTRPLSSAKSSSRIKTSWTSSSKFDCWKWLWIAQQSICGLVVMDWFGM